MTSPAVSAVPPGTVASFASVTLGFWTIVTDAVSLSLASASLAPWSVATDAVLVMLPPASISACVTVWLAVYCHVSPRSSLPS